ncbi:MAG: site-2 protease family protein [Verrucomicrobiota bacterium]
MDPAPQAAAATPQYRQPRHFLAIGLLAYAFFRFPHAWSRENLVAIAAFGFVLSQPLGVVIHELGHAVAAALTGMRVLRIKLGLTQSPIGPHLAFRFLGFRWEIYALPTSGSVQHLLPATPERFRTRSALVTAAGPLASLAAAAAALPVIWAGIDDPGAALAAGWAALNLLFFLSTAIPYAPLRSRGLPSDGLRFWRHLSLTDEEVRRKSVQSRLRQDYDAEKAAVGTLTSGRLVARYEADPQRMSTLVHLIDRLRADKDPREAAYLARLLEWPHISPEHAVDYLDQILTAQLNAGTIRNGALFDQLSQKLLELAGNSVTARGTRGSVLVDLGRIEEGAAMLEGVLAETTSSVDKGYANVFLALAEKQLGHLDAAREHARAAAGASPGCEALPRVADLLAPPAPVGALAQGA